MVRKLPVRWAWSVMAGILALWVAVAMVLGWIRPAAGLAFYLLAAWQIGRRCKERELIDLILDHVQDGVVACDERGRIVFSNRAYQRMSERDGGHPERGDCGHGCRKCVGKEDCPVEPSAMEAALRGEPVVNRLRLAGGAGGATVELSVNGRPIQGATGRKLGAVMTLRDVTKERTRERALRASEERYRNVVAAMSEGMIMRNRQGQVIAHNENALRILRLPEEDLLAKPAPLEGWQLLNAGGVPLALTEYPCSVALRTGVAQRGVEAMISRNGDPRRWIRMNSEPVMEPGDILPVAVVTTFLDVTARKRAEMELLERQEALEEAQRLARIGSWRWDPQCDRVEWSRELFRIFGRDPERGGIGYADQRELYTVESFARLDSAVQRALRTGEPYEVELEVIRGDGTHIWAVARGEAERDEGGRITGLRGTLQEVTAKRMAEAALREAKEAAESAARTKSEFLANMSHEIRTPMNGIVGMTSLLLLTSLNGEQRECVETVRASSEALLAILNDVLDFSKIEAGKLEIERVPFDLERMVEDAIDVVAESASQKGLAMHFYVNSELPPVVIGDALRLRQILLNFLSNAIKFTETGGVTVLVEPYEAQPAKGVAVRIAVSDSGSGLSDAQQAMLFRSFTQLNASTTRKHGGTGLGLSISRRLAELMGGHVGVESVQGQGSTFWLTVEVGVSEMPLPAPLSDDLLAGRRVVVAANQALGLLLVRQQLESLGLQMVTARTEAEAYAAVEGERPGEPAVSAVLVDVDMAGVDAMELARQLRARSAAEVLPVVFLGSVRDQRLMTEAAGMGNTAYLMKPLRKTSLTRALCRLIRQPEGQEVPERTLYSRMEAEVLLAEDNLTNQRVATMMLHRFGCRTDVVGNGEEALEALRRKRYNVIFMDCQMPVMDGWAAALAIREMEGDARRTPIVALTANAMSGDRERCMAAGMDDYLKKPLSLAQMHEQLTKWARPAGPVTEVRTPD